MSRARDGDGAGDGAGDGDGADDVAGDGTTAIAAPAAAEAPLRPGWKAVVADDRRTYYWCVATGETSWERPTATARGSADDGAWEHDLFAADDDEEALPAAGTAVLAQYSSHSAWRPARAHGAAAGGVGLRVIFDGYGDVVDVGLRWHLPGRGDKVAGAHSNRACSRLGALAGLGTHWGHQAQWAPTLTTALQYCTTLT